jgi:hypothetical protein
VLSIFEDGIPPVFRVDFQNWTGVAPNAADITVTTIRPDASQQVFEFAVREGTSLQSTVDIPEPHEFGAVLKIKGVEYRVEFVEGEAHNHAHGHAHGDGECAGHDHGEEAHDHHAHGHHTDHHEHGHGHESHDDKAHDHSHGHDHN